MGYPVKYAVEELKIEGSFVTNHEDIVKGYIVSKCYVVEDRISYDESFEPIGVKYVVTFPYRNFEEFIRYKRSIEMRGSNPFLPTPDYYETRRWPNEEALDYPTFLLQNLYDSYEEAFLVADSKNNALRGELLLHAPHIGYQEFCNKIDEEFDLCREYEKFVFDNTTDMKVVGDKSKVKLPKKR